MFNFNLSVKIYRSIAIKEEMEAKAASFDKEFVDFVIGQTCFIRALCYIRLTSLWGDVPLVDRVYTPSESKLPRKPVAEIMEKLIVPDLELAAHNLDTVPYNSRLGLATKQSALGLKVRAYLYVQDYENTIKSALDLMELAENTSVVQFLDNYKDIFSNANENNKEILFALKYTAGGFSQGSTFNTTFGSKLPGVTGRNGSWNTIAILPEFLDSYPFVDGKTLEEGSVSYDPQNKWANRGARFESTFYIGDYSILDNGLLYPSGFVANISKQCAKDYPLSLNKGYMNETEKLEWTQEDESDFIILRYTDVLMMYAEAKIMLGQIDESVYKVLDMVRDRAGIARVARGLSKSEMIKIIQDERKWEFAFEGLRYFDIRRWGIADQVINKITSDEKYDFGSHKLFLKGKHELWPIPQSAIDSNPNLLPNNPGY